MSNHSLKVIIGLPVAILNAINQEKYNNLTVSSAVPKIENRPDSHNFIDMIEKNFFDEDCPVCRLIRSEIKIEMIVLD